MVPLRAVHALLLWGESKSPSLKHQDMSLSWEHYDTRAGPALHSQMLQLSSAHPAAAGNKLSSRSADLLIHTTDSTLLGHYTCWLTT